MHGITIVDTSHLRYKVHSKAVQRRFLFSFFTESCHVLLYTLFIPIHFPIMSAGPSPVYGKLRGELSYGALT